MPGTKPAAAAGHRPAHADKKAPRGEVATLQRALLRDVHAAEYMDRKPSWLRAKRAEDVKAEREGRAPTGPRWIVLGKSIFYRPRDLDLWIEAHAIERGVVEFANRGHVEAAGD